MRLVAALCLAALPATMVLIPSQASAQQDVATVYKQRCAGCHGPDGSGQTAMGRSFKLRDLRSPEVQHMTDAQLTEVIGQGKGKMPGYEKVLGAPMVKALVGYIRGMAKK